MGSNTGVVDTELPIAVRLPEEVVARFGVGCVVACEVRMWSMVEVPATAFVRLRGGLNIAYKVVGAGPVDVLFFSQPPIALDATFEHPGHVRFWQFMGRFSRSLGYDRRGVGASDPAPPDSFSDRDAWVEEAVAVLDAVDVGQVVVVGEGYGGHAAIAVAAAVPERVRGLVLVNSYAFAQRTDDNPIGFIPSDALDAVARAVEDRWGTGVVVAETVPHLASGASSGDFCARFERAAASPAPAAAYVKAMFSSDIRDLLGAIAVPTMVLHTGDFPFLPAVHSRYLADHIAGAVLDECEVGSFYGFEPAARQSVREFVGDIRPDVSFERQLLAVLFTDIVSSTEQALTVGDAVWRQRLDDHDNYVRDRIASRHGRVVKQTGDGHLATFAHPTDAIQTAIVIRDAATVHGFDVRAGVHFGEVMTRDDGDITGTAVNIAARVTDHADAGHILISRTVADLIAGTELRLTDVGEHQLKGIPGPWRLFRVTS